MALPEAPNSRAEQYLARIAGQTTTLPEAPHSRVEQYLEEIAINGTVSREEIAEQVSTWLEDNIHEDPTVVIDSSLTISGAAADAKSAGDELSKLNDSLRFNLDIGNSRNVIDDAVIASATSKGITWTANSDRSITVTGTATGLSLFTIYYDSSHIPDWIKKGHTYYLVYHSDNITLHCGYYTTAWHDIFSAKKENAVGNIPDSNDVIGFYLRLRVNSGTVVNETVRPMLFNEMPNSELYRMAKERQNTSTGLSSALLRPAWPRCAMHRGMMLQAPENTIPSFTLAGQAGAWGIETDVQETSDGYFILSHENDVSRMTDGTGNISDMTYEQTQVCTIDSGSNIEQYPNLKMPLLEDYLHICKIYGCVALIEIKTISHFDKLLEVVKKVGMEGSTIFLNYDVTSMGTIRELTSAPIVLLASTTAGVNALPDAVASYSDIWVGIHGSLVTQKLIDDFHAVNVPVTAWATIASSFFSMNGDVTISQDTPKYTPS